MKTTKPPQTPSPSSSSSSCSCSTQSTPTKHQQNDAVQWCRRDANCGCTICLESIKSTLDLMPMSAQRTSLSKLSASKPLIVLPKTPISIDQTLFQPPPSRSRLYPNRARRSSRGCGYPVLRRVLILFALILAGEFGASWLGFRVLGFPRLSPIMVNRLVEGSLEVGDLMERFRVLELGLKEGYGFDGEVSSCASKNSTWKINRDGLLLSSRCTIYESRVEEVAIWGWPLQTAGLLTASFSSRTMTVIAGRITEWGNGGVGSGVARNASSTWVVAKWGGSAVQLDPNTWVLEYKRSALFENPRLWSAVGDLLRFVVSAFVRRVRQELWLLPCVNDCSSCGGEEMPNPRANYGSLPT